ncbi:hypothetical protein KOR42_41650 [Thalassoglobus neptunius]|uniref:Translational regulator CsrA n=1 Tax=Thalassoglobus neptunius TaxID=1938619 RepID=A0A5C5W845_9PLAN|nr:carbon storage regulator [Thalassoglobus neptunius]TWT47068.1 hypothetical protein KOR42_41800 [Thalassoglobus neptunius]TWT47167.1 hypothetical protein KOR42_41650 [Thalassoglobus neptunius]
MLVLSRHVDEDIILVLEDGRRIEIKAVSIRGDKVRMGIEAPRSIGVHRREIWDRMNTKVSAAESA